MPGVFYQVTPDFFEYSNVPKKLRGVCASYWDFKERFKGKKPILEMNDDLKKLLGEPLNDVPVIGRYYPGDIFNYQGRVFYFGHQSEMFSTSSLFLKWGFALFDKETKVPVAYTLFNNQESQKLLTG
jgi:hypothetical protein